MFSTELCQQKLNSVIDMLDNMEDSIEHLEGFKSSIRDLIDEIIDDLEELSIEDSSQESPQEDQTSQEVQTPQEEQPSATKNKIGRPRKYRTDEERREAQRQAVRRSRQRKNEKLALLEQENQRLKEIIPSLSLLQPK